MSKISSEQQHDSHGASLTLFVCIVFILGIMFFKLLFLYFRKSCSAHKHTHYCITKKNYSKWIRSPPPPSAPRFNKRSLLTHQPGLFHAAGIIHTGPDEGDNYRWFFWNELVFPGKKQKLTHNSGGPNLHYHQSDCLQESTTPPCRTWDLGPRTTVALTLPVTWPLTGFFFFKTQATKNHTGSP